VKHKFLLLQAFLLLFILFSCSKVEEVQIDYSGTLAFPLADISFEVLDLIEEDSAFTINDNNAIQLIHREDSLAHIKASDFFDEITSQLTAEGYYDEMLEKINLNEYSRNSTVTFEELLDNFNNTALQQFFQNNDGESVPIMAFDETINKEIVIPIFDEFISLNVESGTIELTITNNYFIDIQNLTIIIQDEISGQDIGSLNFDEIPVNETKTRSTQIANQTINNEISLLIPSLSSPGSASAVQIDLASQLESQIVFKDFIITGGEVKLMGNEIVSDSTLVDFEPNNEAEITRIDIDNGILNYSMKTDFSHELKATIIFPDVLKNGNPLNITMSLPPTGLNDSIVGFIDFSGTSLRLNNNQDQPFNRMRVMVEIQVDDPTNSIIQFDAQDRVAFSFKLENLEINSVFGYFGQFEESIDPQMVNLDFDFGFINENSSPAFFENARIKLESENSFGVPISVDFQAISSGVLTPDQTLEASTFDIDYPTIDQFGEIVFGTNLIDESNSNIIDFLSIYPNQFEVEGTAQIHPAGNQNEIHFVTKDSELKLHGEFDLPFKLRAENIVYRDTSEGFSLGLDDDITIDDIREGELKLLYFNGMPFEIKLDILTIDINGNTQPLVENITLNSASVNSEGVVEANNIFEGETFISLTQNQLRQMDEAAENIFEIRLQSFDNANTPVSILTENGLDIKVGLKVFF
jgi:hypothetical protein